MRERKISANWYVAVIHYLIAGLVLPFVIGFVVGVPLAILWRENFLLFWAAQSVAILLAIWLGVIYSSKYLNRAYIIREAKKIVNLSTIYLTAITLGLNFKDILNAGDFSVVMIPSLITSVATIIVFYLVSKRYIRNNA